MRIGKTLAAATAAATIMLALAGCSSSTGGTTTGLQTADSAVGTIVVDDAGRAVYIYDQDVKGTDTAACTDRCLAAWPAVTLTGDQPTIADITADVDEIDAPDGSEQFTVDGMPVYYYSGDTAEGDITGQGVGGVWWLVAPDGTAIHTLRR